MNKIVRTIAVLLCASCLYADNEQFKKHKLTGSNGTEAEFFIFNIKNDTVQCIDSSYNKYNIELSKLAPDSVSWIFSNKHKFNSKNFEEFVHNVALHLIDSSASYDFKEIRGFLKKASLDGNPEVQALYSTAFYKGLWGLSKWAKPAFDWAEKSANGGSAEGQYLAGMFFYYGIGTSKYEYKSIYLLTKSSEYGNKKAHHILGEIYLIKAINEEFYSSAKKYIRLSSVNFKNAFGNGTYNSKKSLKELYKYTLPYFAGNISNIEGNKITLSNISLNGIKVDSAKKRLITDSAIISTKEKKLSSNNLGVGITVFYENELNISDMFDRTDDYFLDIDIIQGPKIDNAFYEYTKKVDQISFQLTRLRLELDRLKKNQGLNYAEISRLENEIFLLENSF